MNEDLRRHMVQTWNNFYQTIECGDFVAVREKNDENEEVFSNEEISGNFYRGQILDEIKVEIFNDTFILEIRTLVRVLTGRVQGCFYTAVTDCTSVFGNCILS